MSFPFQTLSWAGSLLLTLIILYAFVLIIFYQWFFLNLSQNCLQGRTESFHDWSSLAAAVVWTLSSFRVDAVLFLYLSSSVMECAGTQYEFVQPPCRYCFQHLTDTQIPHILVNALAISNAFYHIQSKSDTPHRPLHFSGGEVYGSATAT